MTSPTVKSVAAQRLLYISGALLVLSGLIHVGVWFVLGGDWEGPVSWRKPILFGISTGLTVLSVGWIYPKLKSRKRDSFLCGLFGLAMVAEVALITIQQWRGVASHFNHTTPLNTLIESWMTYLIIFATVVLVEITRRCFVGLNAPSDLKLAILGGMAFLIVSCLIGFLILIYGNSRAALGADPSIFGRAGVTKFPHGVAIHAIQLFPLNCWLLLKFGVPLKQRTRLIGCLIASISAFLLFSLAQTLDGKARFDLTFSGTFLLIASLLFLVPLFTTLVGFKWPTREQSAPS